MKKVIALLPAHNEEVQIGDALDALLAPPVHLPRCALPALPMGYLPHGEIPRTAWSLSAPVHDTD